MDGGWTDSQFVDLVGRLDASIAVVDGHGFEITPLGRFPELHPGGAAVWVKDETGNVGGSHKSRHLFGVLLAEAVDGAGGGDLAIASCGNAAIAASVIARATDRPLHVFIPTWADQAIVDVLVGNGAHIEVCPRRSGETGDPTYLRFLEAVSKGATPFSVQSPATPTTLDGGRTMGWELADQLAASQATGTVNVFIQVGGGALASATWVGLSEALPDTPSLKPVLYPVQTEACAPLARAWNELMASGLSTTETLDLATADPDRFMRPWEPIGQSEATGILDDVTYDWLPLLSGMLTSGGEPIVVDETTIIAAHQRGRTITNIDVEPTGTAGYAGLLASRRPEPAAVLFTGVSRF